MSTEKQAREQMAQQRLGDEHLQESMLNRAEAEVQQGDNAVTEDLARQQMAQQRLEAEQIQEAMLTRTEAEITE
ncbi:MAG: hypothetical protein WBV73_19625 [Phormidium sp.]